MAVAGIDLGKYKLGWSDSTEDYIYTPTKGINEDIVKEISHRKSEPEWMTKFRLNALKRFERKPMLEWFAKNMPHIDFDDIYYYLKPMDGQVSDWDMLPEGMKDTYEKLGIPEAERKFLAGVTAQYESEVVYHKNREDLEELGVLFSDMDTAVREYPEIVQQYFGTVIPPGDNKFAALNSSVWSGGSFIYVPPGVHVDMPLQAYFRINAENAGQFERTLIIADEGSSVHYVEGCSAPVYSTDSLHSAVVELIAKPGARIRYTTIQNWSPNVYNLVTKRARAETEATVEWIDGNLGSKLTMKYPAVVMVGPKAHGEVLSVAYAGAGQHQDAGEDDPRRAGDHVDHRLEVDRQGRRPHELPRPGEGRRGRAPLEEPCALRRADPRRPQPVRHVAAHGDRREGRAHRARGHGVEGRRRPDLLPDEPRPHRAAGHRDDRERLHRADHEDAPHGVRGRALAAHRAQHGGRSRLRRGSAAHVSCAARAGAQRPVIEENESE